VTNRTAAKRAVDIMNGEDIAEGSGC